MSPQLVCLSHLSIPVGSSHFHGMSQQEETDPISILSSSWPECISFHLHLSREFHQNPFKVLRSLKSLLSYCTCHRKELRPPRRLILHCCKVLCSLKSLLSYCIWHRTEYSAPPRRLILHCCRLPRPSGTMRTTFQILLLPLLAGFAIASLVLEPVVVSYPSDTPQSSVDTAKDVVREAVGAWTPTSLLVASQVLMTDLGAGRHRHLRVLAHQGLCSRGRRGNTGHHQGSGAMRREDRGPM